VRVCVSFFSLCVCLFCVCAHTHKTCASARVMFYSISQCLQHEPHPSPVHPHRTTPTPPTPPHNHRRIHTAVASLNCTKYPVASVSNSSHVSIRQHTLAYVSTTDPVAAVSNSSRDISNLLLCYTTTLLRIEYTTYYVLRLSRIPRAMSAPI
jgi:hypothetical protein